MKEINAVLTDVIFLPWREGEASTTWTSLREASDLTPSEPHVSDSNRQEGPGVGVAMVVVGVAAL